MSRYDLVVAVDGAPSLCEPWCALDERWWKDKCDLDGCSGCGECTANVCKDWCRSVNEPWAFLCTWQQCVGCTECVGSPEYETSDFACSAWCKASPQPWTKKCGWPGCVDCPVCSTGECSRDGQGPSEMALPRLERVHGPPIGTCQPFCAKSTRSWEELCHWEHCDGCPQCAPPSAPPFPPAPPGPPSAPPSLPSPPAPPLQNACGECVACKFGPACIPYDLLPNAAVCMVLGGTDCSVSSPSLPPYPPQMAPTPPPPQLPRELLCGECVACKCVECVGEIPSGCYPYDPTGSAGLPNAEECIGVGGIDCSPAAPAPPSPPPSPPPAPPSPPAPPAPPPPPDLDAVHAPQLAGAVISFEDIPAFFPEPRPA